MLGGLDQLAQRALLAGGELRSTRVAPYDPPLFTAEQRASLARIEVRLAGGGPAPVDTVFDAALGWTTPAGGGSGDFTYDWAGCRIGVRELSREKRPGVRRVVLVGGSFTRGDEVPPLEAWATLVDEAAAELEVANLGVGGYGLDQALLRLERDGLALAPDEVWLGLMPQALLRVLNVYRPALRHWTPSVAFKPRFALDGAGALALVPCPVSALADVPPLFGSQERFLAAVGRDDFWIERARAAWLPAGTHWTHRSALARIALTLHEKRARAARDWMEPDGELAGPVEPLVVALLARARASAETAGARFRLLVLPSRPDLAPAARPGGRAYWTDVVAPQADVLVDLSAALEAAGAATDERFWRPGGHYARSAHEVIARELLRATGAAR